MSQCKTILLAEDSPDDEFFFKDLIRRSRFPNPVKVVRDGAEAIAYLNRDGRFADAKTYPFPSALFLDLKMPKRNGFEVLLWIKTQPQLKDLLRVILTQNQELTAIRQAYELGAHSFLTKPVIDEEVNNLMLSFPAAFHGCDVPSNPGAVPRPESAEWPSSSVRHVGPM
jgi:CheY-like chemotaxis protein